MILWDGLLPSPSFARVDADGCHRRQSVWCGGGGSRKWGTRQSLTLQQRTQRHARRHAAVKPKACIVTRNGSMARPSPTTANDTVAQMCSADLDAAGWENSSGEVNLERHGERKKHKSLLNFVFLTFWFTLKNISILNEHLPSWFTTHLIKKINVLSYETSRLLAFCLTWLLRIQFRDITCYRP